MRKGCKHRGKGTDIAIGVLEDAVRLATSLAGPVSLRALLNTAILVEFASDVCDIERNLRRRVICEVGAAKMFTTIVDRKLPLLLQPESKMWRERESKNRSKKFPRIRWIYPVSIYHISKSLKFLLFC
jgi:hypothetical protein